MTHRGEARSRRDARRHGRRRHRGRLSDRLGRRFPGRQRDRQAHQERRDLRPRPAPAPKDIDRCAEAIKPAERGRIHTFIVDLAGAHEVQAADGAGRRSIEMVDRHGDPRPQPHRRRRMVGRGRHPHRASISSAAASRPRSRPAPPPSTFPTPSATRCRRNISRCSRMLRERVPNSDKARVLGALPQRSRHGGGEFAGRRRAPARGRSNAPSTASASAPATPRWKKS